MAPAAKACCKNVLLSLAVADRDVVDVCVVVVGVGVGANAEQDVARIAARQSAKLVREFILMN